MAEIIVAVMDFSAEEISVMAVRAAQADVESGTTPGKHVVVLDD
ncbi:hypothetical protein [Nonomuraea sp. NPDC050691]